MIADCESSTDQSRSVSTSDTNPSSDQNSNNEEGGRNPGGSTSDDCHVNCKEGSLIPVSVPVSNDEHEVKSPYSTAATTKITRGSPFAVSVARLISRRPRLIILVTISFSIIVSLLALFVSDFQLATENKKGKVLIRKHDVYMLQDSQSKGLE